MNVFSFPSIKDDQHMGKLLRVTIYPKVIVKRAQCEISSVKGLYFHNLF